MTLAAAARWLAWVAAAVPLGPVLKSRMTSDLRLIYATKHKRPGLPSQLRRPSLFSLRGTGARRAVQASEGGDGGRTVGGTGGLAECGSRRRFRQ